jgi:hypothetical protein
MVKQFLDDRIMPEQGIKRWLWVLSLKENTQEIIGAVSGT